VVNLFLKMIVNTTLMMYYKTCHQECTYYTTNPSSVGHINNQSAVK